MFEIERKILEDFFYNRLPKEDWPKAYRLLEDPRYSELVGEFMKEQWQQQEETETTKDEDSKKRLSRLHQQLQFTKTPLTAQHGRTRANPYLTWLKIASIIVLPLLFIVGLYQFNDLKPAEPVAMVRKSTQPGTRMHLTLPDSSIVWLNGDSQLSFPEKFEENERRVLLTGEAFFEVKKNPSKPFIVQTAHTEVEALGTSFNVNTTSQKQEEVALVTGKVEVRFSKGNNKVDALQLTPNEMAKIDLENRQLSKGNFDYEDLVGWKEYILNFQNVGLEDITEKLERYYGVRIEIQGLQKSHQAWKFKARFEKQSLENVLKSLSFTKKFAFTITGKQVTIKL
ncbi:FecR domain-containing protein [Rapidithrix thailandica]|uniref:FecR domain-containing protein n=1 Tax=Rapidithrix thailandica TaxID=413964 RepID=A0AAW9S3I2_9BACT